MPKRIALLATAAALAVVPAVAQQSTSPGNGQPAPQAQPAPQTQQEPQAQPNQTTQAQPAQAKKAFIDAQSPDQWLGSKLVGLRVKGAGDENIGSINDLLIDKDGTIKAAVIGVGGFLGIGQKNVAVSFESLDMMRTPDGTQEARLLLTKAELEGAPDFKPYEPPHPAASRPAGGAPGTAKKPGGSGM